MAGCMKMRGRVLVGGIVAAADVTAAAADPQMQPRAAACQAFLAAERARRDLANAADVGAAFCHGFYPRLKRRPCGVAEKTVQRRHHLRAFADRAADALDRSGAHV